jgi:hypothetical protein
MNSKELNVWRNNCRAIQLQRMLHAANQNSQRRSRTHSRCVS